MALCAVASLAQRPAAHPVVVELFTSEGCSSCPPADDLLLRLDRQPVSGADVIVLSEHVDYWDRLGWKDRFSSHDFTQRQQDYASLFKLGDIYTPQTVVNGTAQFNGADGRGIAKAIERAAANNPVSMMFTDVQLVGDKLSFSLGGTSPLAAGKVDLFAALVDPSTTTDILAGENQGRKLRQAGVVRTMERVGSSLQVDALYKRHFTVHSTVRGTLDGMRLVVFVQTGHIGPVMGAASCLLGDAAAVSAPGKQSLYASCPRLSSSPAPTGYSRPLPPVAPPWQTR